MNVTRREAIVKMATLMGASVLSSRLLSANFAGDTDPTKPPLAEPREVFSADEIGLLDEIGETIIPATHVPGAKAVGIGAFIAMMVNDCYRANEQTAFHQGLRSLPASYQERYNETFIQGSAANRTAFLTALDQEQRVYSAKQKERKKFIRENAAAEESADSAGDVPHYFRMMKELTILGYFTSELGSTQVLGWIEVPGHFDGDVPYKKGDKPGTMMRV